MRLNHLKRPSIAIIIIACGLILSGCTNNSTTQQNLSDSNNQGNLETISISSLSQSNGKNGKPCYVAVDGIVYEVQGVPEWQNGEHITTSGVTCGEDLSDKIKESPHGRSVLSGLKVIGELE